MMARRARRIAPLLMMAHLAPLMMMARRAPLMMMGRRAPLLRLAPLLLLAAAFALAGAILPAPRPAEASTVNATAIRIATDPGVDGYYATGDRISFEVTFDQTMKDWPSPYRAQFASTFAGCFRFSFLVGSTTRYACGEDHMNGTHNSTTVLFHYDVVVADHDADGISVPTAAVFSNTAQVIHLDSGADHQLGAASFPTALPDTLNSAQAAHLVNTADFDADDDDLIEITTPAQLNAIRYDLDGNGSPSSGNEASYGAAFAGAQPGMGCASGAGMCDGYELDASLDFTGTTYATGAGWVPIGTQTAAYVGHFNGQGHTISNLRINSSDVRRVGLFGNLWGAQVSDLGLLNVNITAGYTSAHNNPGTVGALSGRVAGAAVVRSAYATGDIAVNVASTAQNLMGSYAGGLVGEMENNAGTRIFTSYADVDITVSSAATTTSRFDLVGGLVGLVQNPTGIISSYATGDLTASRTGASGGCKVGGLVGETFGGAAVITASYAIGVPTCNPASGGTDDEGGLVGRINSGASITASYWDTTTSGTTNAHDGGAYTGITGKTTAELRTPEAYGTQSTDIYMNWNVNVDGDTSTGTPTVGGDDPWDFGTASEYPILKFGYDDFGQAVQRPTDYTGDNNLIDVSTLAQLDAMRYDLRGKGEGALDPDSRAAYLAAYPGLTRCAPTTCAGYELTADLDFDTGTAGVRTDDQYWNGGAGWTPIGVTGEAPPFLFGATFDGNNHTISNLYIDLNTSTIYGGLYVGLVGYSVGGAIRNVGLVNPSVTNTRTSGGTTYTGALVGRLGSGGSISNSYVSGGTVTLSDGAGAAPHVGCLVGFISRDISDSWASCAVNSASAASGVANYAGGLVGRSQSGSITGSYATGSVTITGSGDGHAGGLAGSVGNGSITSSYAAGAVSNQSTYASGGYAGGLVGLMSSGDIKASYAAGNVEGAVTPYVGGLAARALLGGSNVAHAVYAHGSAKRTSTSGGGNVGGLIGHLTADTGRTNVVRAAYAIGEVSNADTTTPGVQGGLIGGVANAAAPVSDSYWNNEAVASGGTGRSSSAGGGSGLAGSALQTPTGYGSGSTTPPSIYANWNLDLDSTTGPDDPWDFGASSQYPVLQYQRDVHAIVGQRSDTETDYDGNDNNLIDVATLAQLDAIRYDLDGDGVTTVTGADAAAYAGAFPGLTRGMGCPGGCGGYELRAHLDFDTAGDDDTADAPYANWDPIGSASDYYTSRFAGNGYTISNLTINRPAVPAVGLFARTSNASAIVGVGLVKPNVRGQQDVGALVGLLHGKVAASYSAGGTVRSAATGSDSVVGGLVGWVGNSGDNANARIIASYSSAVVTSGGAVGGGLAGRQFGDIRQSYAIGSVTVVGNIPGGLVGLTGAGQTTTSSYFNSSVVSASSSGTGRSTSQLQTPTGYGAQSTDTYYAWNVDVDGDNNADDPWDFGTDSQYPVVKYGGRSTAWQGRGGFAWTQNSAAVTALMVDEEDAAGATYAVALAVRPDADVTVTITSPADDEVTADTGDGTFSNSETLDFTAANWDTPQTVTIKATADADVGNDSDTLTLTAADAGGAPSGYAGVSRSVGVTVDDNDTAAILLTQNGNPITAALAINEQDAAVTYGVALSNLPSAGVTVMVSSDDAAVTVNPSSLMFTTGNYATPKMVTLNAPDDGNSIHESVTITHTAEDTNTNSPSGYDDPDGGGPLMAVSKTLSVSVTDNDTPSLRVSASSLTLNEDTTGNGHQDSFTVRLNSQPTASVTVAITSDNADVRLSSDGGTTYGSSVSLTFNATGGSLWDATQTVNVQAGTDADGDDDTASLTFNISGGNYGTVTHTAVSVTVMDKDDKGITLSETGNLPVREGEAPASYTVVLDTEPSAAVRVSVSSSDNAKVSVSASSGGGFGGSLTLSFNAANYSDAQTVYVRGNADDDTVGETGITIAHTYSGGGYDDVATVTLQVMLTDTSTPGLLINPSALGLKEGTEGNYTVRLNTQPASNVTVAITRTGAAAVTFDDAGDGNFASGGSLTFTAGNWNNPQTVKVRAPQVDANATATLSHDASGADYGTVPDADLSVNVRDNLPPIANAGLDQEAYTGQTITLDGSGSSDPDDDDSTLRYAWRQTTLTDTRPISLIRANTARASFAVPTDLSADTEVEFELTVTDGAGVSDTDTVKAKLLAARPNELVSLTVTAGAGSDATQRPLTPPFASIQRSFDSYVGAYTTTAQIRMTPADPGASVSLNGDNPPAIGARTVRVSLAEGHNRFTIKVSPRPIEAGGQPLQPVTYRLNIRRQRAPRLAFEPERLLLNEGSSAAYTVELDTRWLGAEVVITITSDNPDVTVAPAQVSISQHDWSPRTITVTAADDADGADDFATLRHLANGGQFNNVGGRVWVEVSDDDEPTSPAPTPTPTPGPTPTPAPGQTPTPGPTPTPTPAPTPTPMPGLPKIATTFTTEVPVDGQMVTITREAGSLAGVTLALPSVLTRNLRITIAPLADDIPLSSSRYGLGTTPAAQAGAALTVTGAPAGGLHLCLPLSDALVSEAGSRPLTLVRYGDAGWQALPGAERREMSVCAPGVATGVFAAAYVLPQLGPASDLTVTAGDTAGTLALRWTAGANATRHWVAGIKQSDWDAGDFSNLIWTAAGSNTMHVVSDLDSGAEYVFAVAAGRGDEWSGWTGLVRGTPN